MGLEGTRGQDTPRLGGLSLSLPEPGVLLLCRIRTLTGDTKADSIRRAVLRSSAFERVGRKVRLKVSESDQSRPAMGGQHHEF